ncbi:ANTAR domain-containing protein [Cryobacterium sp. TMT1-21]|uniref:ANTAR domain-containing protein n=2 Tax=Microbacteriaceae TaxID=85023 RepID=A0AAQ2C8W3_9MICO|nr:ANTAR domain-containing protein [Cryobacterium shii]TFC82353.1 ANTAR domain-containing protein [Cryobacterium sp. TmT2-59]TFD16355.1 ANTAR domain-containing protein [Cryobacterium sp. TMT1-21]TFD44029.1 ANTAR domain-containing protein [Cryobacterium sp. TMT2-10]
MSTQVPSPRPLRAERVEGVGVMTRSDRLSFGVAVEELTSAHLHQTNLCAPFLRALPVDGLAISTLGVPFGTETICASNAAAARIDEIQFDLGEGPCWDARATRRPVLSPDIRHEANLDWPVFQRTLGDTEVGGIFAFPMLVGSLDIGAVDFYSRMPRALTLGQIEDATTLVGIAARQVLRRVLLSNTMKPDADDDRGYSRRVVHQATGMVLAQLDVSPSDALLILQGYAFSHGQTVREVAENVVARNIDFTSELN